MHTCCRLSTVPAEAPLCTFQAQMKSEILKFLQEHLFCVNHAAQVRFGNHWAEVNGEAETYLLLCHVNHRPPGRLRLLCHTRLTIIYCFGTPGYFQCSWRPAAAGTGKRNKPNKPRQPGEPGEPSAPIEPNEPEKPWQTRQNPSETTTPQAHQARQSN